MCSDHLALIIALGGIDGQRAVGIGYRVRNQWTLNEREIRLQYKRLGKHNGD
jgi:hypothetical protein